MYAAPHIGGDSARPNQMLTNFAIDGELAALYRPLSSSGGEF
jgi:hypothetical protein